jgi:hypothetical protein
MVVISRKCPHRTSAKEEEVRQNSTTWLENRPQRALRRKARIPFVLVGLGKSGALSCGPRLGFRLLAGRRKSNEFHSVRRG